MSTTDFAGLKDGDKPSSANWNTIFVKSVVDAFVHSGASAVTKSAPATITDLIQYATTYTVNDSIVITLDNDAFSIIIASESITLGTGASFTSKGNRASASSGAGGAGGDPNGSPGVAGTAGAATYIFQGANGAAGGKGGDNNTGGTGGAAGAAGAAASPSHGYGADLWNFFKSYPMLKWLLGDLIIDLQ